VVDRIRRRDERQRQDQCKAALTDAFDCYLQNGRPRAGDRRSLGCLQAGNVVSELRAEGSGR
jgi:hypothetical protein